MLDPSCPNNPANLVSPLLPRPRFPTISKPLLPSLSLRFSPAIKGLLIHLQPRFGNNLVGARFGSPVTTKKKAAKVFH